MTLTQDWTKDSSPGFFYKLRSSLEGHLTNVEEGFSSTQKLLLVVEEHLKLIEDLEPHLKLARWID